MQGIVVYQTKYGSTRQYAEWIAEELSMDLEDVEDVEPGRLSEYDMVILGSHVRAGTIAIANWVRERASELEGKNIFFFTVSGSSPQKKDMYGLFKETFPGSFGDQARFFALHGRMRYKELDRIDKVTMKMGVLMSRSGKDRDALHKGYDHVKKKAIFGIVKAARQAMKTT